MHTDIRYLKGAGLRDVAVRDVEIGELISQQSQLAEALDRIVNTLEGATQHNGAKAVLKLLDAHRAGQIKVFISYKSSEVEGASKLRQILRTFAGDRLDIFLAKESIKGGDEWQKEIYDALTKAHWLIVLYPDRNQDCTWVVFETGHFHGKYLPGDRLLCIHPENQSPFDGVSRFQTFPSTEERLFDLLHQLLRTPNPIAGMRPLNDAVSDATLMQSAKELAQVLQPKRSEWIRRGAYLDVKMPLPTGPRDVDAIFAASVDAADNLEEVFGITRAGSIGRTIASLLKELPETPQRDKWVATLAKAATDALADKASISRCASFVGKSGTLYRPQLFAFAREGKTMRIRVVFSEALSARPIHVADKLLAFQTALRLTFRTKWEFVEGFKRATSKEDVSRAEHLLNTLEAEAALDGSSDEELLTSCFEEKEANTLKGMFEEWRKLRGADDGSDSGSSLANAFRTGDAKMLRACLNTLERINTRYASMAAKRLPYIVREYWR